MSKDQDFQIFGIFGYPLGHTLSPRMQEAAFAKSGIKAFYLTLELPPKEFRKTLRGLNQSNLSGFNLTVPYKEAILSSLRHVSPEARAVGAVNTVYRKGASLHGANTDVSGFLTSLEKTAIFQSTGKSVLVLGAGGSARAVIYGLASQKARRITIANRNPLRAKKILRDYKPLFPKLKLEAISIHDPQMVSVINNADLIVNCTSVGLQKKDKSLIPVSWIPKAAKKNKKVFFDLIYNPPVTDFLKKAKSQGHTAVNGMDMLLYQGAAAFELWTKKAAPVSVMRKALVSAIGDRS